MQEAFNRYNWEKAGGSLMLQFRILEILEEQGHSKYWLYKQMEMSYQNFNKIVNNQTSGIHFDTLEKISDILGCPVGDLFEKINDPDQEQP